MGMVKRIRNKLIDNKKMPKHLKDVIVAILWAKPVSNKILFTSHINMNAGGKGKFYL